jgi:hypothetical protein
LWAAVYYELFKQPQLLFSLDSAAHRPNNVGSHADDNPNGEPGGGWLVRVIDWHLTVQSMTHLESRLVGSGQWKKPKKSKFSSSTA